MSKRAEEAALKAYPPETRKAFELLPKDWNKPLRTAYVKGYEQAEKDCRLTREDVEKIVSIYLETEKNPFLSHEDIILNTLLGFKDWKNNQ